MDTDQHRRAVSTLWDVGGDRNPYQPADGKAAQFSLNYRFHLAVVDRQIDTQELAFVLSLEATHGSDLGGEDVAGFWRFQTDKVRPSPGLLVKPVGRSAPGLAKHDLKVSPSNS